MLREIINTKTKRNGFTLVELSIVIVIVGLLISGILVGQSLVESARINSLIKQVQQYDIAVINFKEKYRGWPGDIKNIFPNGGNGNGRLEDSTIQSGMWPFAEYFNNELSNFWRHLSLSGFKPEGVTYSNNSGSGIRQKQHIPQAAFGEGERGKAGILLYNNLSPVNASYAVYWFSDFNKTTNTLFNTDTLFGYAYTPLELLAIDSKIDNGKRGGIVSAYSLTGGCYTGLDYKTNNTKECLLWIRAASNVGGLKN